VVNGGEWPPDSQQQIGANRLHERDGNEDERVSSRTARSARKPLVEYVFDHNDLVVLLVLGAVHQRHVGAPARIS